MIFLGSGRVGAMTGFERLEAAVFMVAVWQINSARAQSILGQEKIEEHQQAYRCQYCKIATTIIFGLLENHAENCTYRMQQSKWVQIEAKLKPRKEHFDEPHADEVD